MTVLASHLDAPPPKGSSPPSAVALDADELKELLRAVNETTERLQHTHATLQQEVVRLKGELAEANAQLRRSRSLAALGEMAAGIAHEIRNPLGSIQLYVQMLAEDLADAPAQGQLCEKIERAVTGLDAIVRDVLLFAREMTLRATPTSADELIGQTLLACEGLLAAADVELTVDADAAGELVADVTLITQALGNLLRNAIEAMGEAPSHRRRLLIEACRQRVRCPDGRRAERIVIAVEDSGPGIPTQVVERMFNPFFTTRKTGTGLGLAIVHRIVDAHGGHVGVRNGRGGGARVELCLPRTPTTDAPASPVPETAAADGIHANGSAAAAPPSQREVGS